MAPPGPAALAAAAAARARRSPQLLVVFCAAVALLSSTGSAQQWVEVYRCTHTGADTATGEFLFDVPSIQVLATSATQIKISPTSGDDPNFTVTSQPDNFVVANMRNGLSLSHTSTDETTTGYSAATDWQGSTAATARVALGTCGEARPLSVTFFWACGNTNGLHITQGGQCVWDYNQRATATDQISVFVNAASCPTLSDADIAGVSPSTLCAGTAPGSSCTVSCDAGRELVPPSATALQCGVDSTWGAFPECKFTRPASVAHPTSAVAALVIESDAGAVRWGASDASPLAELAANVPGGPLLSVVPGLAVQGVDVLAALTALGVEFTPDVSPVGASGTGMVLEGGADGSLALGASATLGFVAAGPLLSLDVGLVVQGYDLVELIAAAGGDTTPTVVHPASAGSASGLALDDPAGEPSVVFGAGGVVELARMADGRLSTNVPVEVNGVDVLQALLTLFA